MEQFNLERALAGEPVITRNGKEVKQLTRIDYDTDYVIFGVIDRELYRWTINGEYFVREEDGRDLFMKPKENALWLNVWKDRDSGKLFIGQAHREEALAQRAIDSTHAEHIKTIKIDDKK
jgi:hypothetical protein